MGPELMYDMMYGRYTVPWDKMHIHPILRKWSKGELSNEEAVHALDRLLEKDDMPVGNRGYTYRDMIRSIRQQIIRHGETYAQKLKEYFEERP
jgi:hypothetical protein